MAIKKITERLFLSKSEDTAIYVDMKDAPLHYLDGVRFLYAQFKKLTRGVVFNDPDSTGQIQQVSQFLGSLHSTLDEHPVLILAHEQDIGLWVVALENAQLLSNEISIDACNIFTKYKILIQTKYDKNLTRRKWSTVIIHKGDKDVFSGNFDANFVIWICSLDMKKNVQTFVNYYNWLNPEDRLKVEMFIPKSNDIHDTVEKAVLLDYYLENCVLRRNNISAELVKAQFSEIQPPIAAEIRKSLKNKDPTGTKVKRTRKKPEETAPQVTEVKNVDNEIITHDTRATGATSSVTAISQALSNERRSVPTKSTVHTSNPFCYNQSDTDEEIAELTCNDNPTHTVAVQRFSNESQIDQDSDDDYEMPSSKRNRKIYYSSDEGDKDVDQRFKDSGSDINFGRAIYELDRVQNMNRDSPVLLNFDAPTDDSSLNEERYNFVRDNESPDLIDNFSFQVDDAVMEEQMADDKEIGDNNIETNVPNVRERLANSSNLFSEDNFLQNDGTKHTLENYSEAGSSKYIKNDSLTAKSSNVREMDDKKTKVESKIKDYDTILSELEEKALKKFKGSLLDSIF